MYYTPIHPINFHMLRIPLLILIIGIWGCNPASNTQTNPTSPEDSTQSLPEAQPVNTPKITLEPPVENKAVTIGAEVLIQSHLAALKGKKVAVIANHTTLIQGTHLVDTLLASGVQIQKVFAPEHGFRGAADAGQKIDNATDPRTGLPILSLYGKSRKPSAENLADIDLVIFDIQDIGSRHYTYISTMAYAMEACAEQGKAFWVLDRPNPNGWYCDGPVLSLAHSSFIGLHSVPIVHGMTVGEYATMVNREGWLKNGVQAELTVITCKGYTHDMRWEETGLPWVAPSPNIPTAYAAYLYPALCWFEPTLVSVGRGTHEAFTFIGAPWFLRYSEGRVESSSAYGLKFIPFAFTPVSIPGKSTYPKYQDEECQGIKFTNQVEGKNLFLAGLALLELMYNEAESRDLGKPFFTGNFERWAGNTTLQQQIQSQQEPEAIYDSWQEGLASFQSIRNKYLLYE